MSDWWAKKLGNPPAPQQSYVPVPVVPQAPTPPTKPVARLTSSAGMCPDCGSDNFMSGLSGARPRCYDCGYPISQSSSGINTLVRPKGVVIDPVVQKAGQVSVENNYHPEMLIGRDV